MRIGYLPISFSPLAAQEQQGRIDVIGQKQAQKREAVREGFKEFGIVLAEIAASIIIPKVGGFLLKGVLAGTKLAEAASKVATVTTRITSALDKAVAQSPTVFKILFTQTAKAVVTKAPKQIIAFNLVGTASEVIQGEKDPLEILKRVGLTTASILGFTALGGVVKGSLIKVERALWSRIPVNSAGFRDGGMKFTQIINGKEIVTYSSPAAEAFHKQLRISKVIGRFIDGGTNLNILRSAKSLDSIVATSLGILKLKHIIAMLRKVAFKNERLKRLYYLAARRRQKLLLARRKAIRRFRKKFNKISKTFSVDKVRKAFNKHFDKQTREYNKLIQQSRADTTEVEKLKLKQDMDNFILKSQGAVPIEGKIGSQWLLGYKWFPNINKNKPVEEQLDATTIEGSLRVFFKSRVPKRARISHKGKTYYAKPMKAAITFKEVPYQVFQGFINSSSPGEYYWNNFAMHRLKGGGKTKGWQPRSSVDIDFLIDKQSVGSKAQSGLYGLGGVGGNLKTLLFKQLGYIKGMEIYIKHWNDTKKVIGYIKNPLGSTFNLAKKSLGKRLSIGK